MPIYLIVAIMPVLDAVWWRWADRRLRGLPRAGRWRALLALFVVSNLAIYAWVISARMGRFHSDVPTAALIACYVWHLVVLPASVLALAGGAMIRFLIGSTKWLVRALSGRHAIDSAPQTADMPADPLYAAPAIALSRRQVLAAAVVALPPVATAAMQVSAWSQLSSFRVRHLTVKLSTLPAALDGLTIAHVSDLHVGRFTHGRILRDVVTCTRDLRPDLVLLTGDLIDHALSDLPEGLEVLKELARPQRLFTCEGNHDLFESRAEFERRVRAAGVPLLLNESALLEIRGQPVQILGLRWGQTGSRRGAQIDAQMEAVLPLRRPEAFPILLAHHPHAFDWAAAAGIPLTLSGHTHGGQLMLTKNAGAGPLLFKYWSGLYRNGASALAVSNGVGNWMPLRINAPAEILHLTLRTAESRV